MLNLIIDYVEKKIEILKLDVGEKAVISAGFITFVTCVLISLIFFVVLFNIGVAFWLGNLMGNYSYGFFSVAGFYLLLLVVIIMMRKTITKSVANFIIRSFND